MSQPGTACRPQGRRGPERGYVYHRWVCAWAIRVADTEYTCDYGEEWLGGQVLIAGSRHRGSYNYRVLNGMTCDT